MAEFVHDPTLRFYFQVDWENGDRESDDPIPLTPQQLQDVARCVEMAKGYFLGAVDPDGTVLQAYNDGGRDDLGEAAVWVETPEPARRGASGRIMPFPEFQSLYASLQAPLSRVISDLNLKFQPW